MKKQLKNKTVCAIIRTNQELAGLYYSFAYKSFHKSPFSTTKAGLFIEPRLGCCYYIFNGYYGVRDFFFLHMGHFPYKVS